MAGPGGDLETVVSAGAGHTTIETLHIMIWQLMPRIPKFLLSIIITFSVHYKASITAKKQESEQRNIENGHRCVPYY